MLRSKWIRAVVLISLIAAAFTLQSTSTSARTSPPSARLLTVLTKLTVDRFKGDTHLYFSPGIYVASVNGPFEIDALVGSDGRVTLTQVKRDSAGNPTTVREISTPKPVRLENGLPAFFDLTLRDSKGNVLVNRTSPFCPGGNFGQARADASGPANPTFPYDCGGALAQGEVWGIDQGWANELNVGIPFKAPDGTYSLTVTIDPFYARQLDIPADQVTQTVQLNVKTGTGIVCPPGAICVKSVPANMTTHANVRFGAIAGNSAVAYTGTPKNSSGTPDLRALPAHDLSITHTHSGKDLLGFGATIWNAGTGPLVLEGFRTTPSETMPVTQFIYQNGQPVSSQVVGTFEFDHRPGHNHWHMEDVAQYDLLDSAGNRVLLSQKQSFCLAPTDAINLTTPGADWLAYSTSLYSACQGEDAIWIREVLPAGWGDTYFQSVAGQAFNITSVPNGHYQLRVTVDPFNHLLETDYTNNVGLLRITLGGTTGHRTLKIG